MTTEISTKQREQHQQAFLRSFLIGALLAVSVFFVEAGVSEILLARDAQCRANLRRMRLAPNPEELCQPEWQSLMLRAASRGVVGLFFPSAGPGLAWVGMALIYAMVGGFCARFSGRAGVILFLTINLALTAFLAGLGYLSQFVLLPWI
ncbi:MAG: hypothetical protein GTO14_02665 [Anaerolineales bacterium]|nr:hypothetical protein [Anaerolineales bacterium]